ncbi:hypothetical protein TC_0162 [Chlamydia muridarum str. Nigg]|uniref:Uncharacterized protein n=1 Tax=Chlamydia muridarum (strain MoPn / Nigg) TaxID=243161 RepID=Q9PLE2_CHLMU|nr:hypothetical protein TC_0162 [Chlamydia muridarum str. Nigg]AHH22555.1 hypothetical protein TAC_00865 [Chlamydia muridarum str. Nigg3 CMUT3-5]AHH23479.1 hypothetical protein Y015_00865 [Chlamydia muridarum str. Nigg CM972]
MCYFQIKGRENTDVFSFYFGERKLLILSLQNFSSLM